MTEDIKKKRGRPPKSNNKISVQEVIKSVEDIGNPLDILSAGFNESLLTLYQIVTKTGEFKEASITNALQAAKTIAELTVKIYGDELKDKLPRKTGGDLTGDKELTPEITTGALPQEQISSFAEPQKKVLPFYLAPYKAN